MPFDALVAVTRQSGLSETLTFHGLQPVPWETLAAHKAAQQERFGPSFWFRHQATLSIVLVIASPVAGAVAESYLVEQGSRLLDATPGRRAGELHRKGYILQSRHAGDQIERLKDKTHRTTTEQRQRVLVHFFEALTVHGNFPGGGAIQSPEQI